MKKYTAALALPFALMLLFGSCEKIKETLDVPLHGTITGTIRDSLTGFPLHDVVVTADYIIPDNDNGEHRKLVFETATDGTYILKDVWDEVFVKVEKPGFQSQAFTLEIGHELTDKPFDITMIGMPGVVAELVTDLDLEYAANDSAIVHIEIRDLYNDNTSGEYKAYIFFYEIHSDLNLCALELTRKFPGQTFVTMAGTLSASCFPDPQGVPTQYSYYYEIVDPDGHFIEYGLDTEGLDTLTVH